MTPDRPNGYRPDLPPITSGGVLILTPNPQPEVRKNAEASKDWEYAEQARFLYRWAVQFRDDLIDPVLKPGKPRLPDPVISFDRMNVRTLAAYTLARNPQGLLYEITMNTAQYETEEGKQVWKYGNYAMLETLFHELLHLWQQNAGDHPYKSGRVTHNAEFCAKAEYFGLHPKNPEGWHIKQADGIFLAYLARHGIQPDPMPQEAPGDMDWFKWLIDIFGGKETKGRSSLTKWSCGCQNVRVGTKEFFASCTRCNNPFVKVEGGK